MDDNRFNSVENCGVCISTMVFVLIGILDIFNAFLSMYNPLTSHVIPVHPIKVVDIDADDEVEIEVEIDVDNDVEADVDVDVEADVDVDVEADVDVEVDADVDIAWWKYISS